MSRCIIPPNYPPVNTADAGSIWHVAPDTYGESDSICPEQDNPDSGNTSGPDPWGTEPSYACGKTLVSLYSEAQRRAKVIRLHCGRLTCPVCGPYWRKKLRGHLKNITWGHRQLFLISAPRRRREALVKGLQRAMKEARTDGRLIHGWAGWIIGGEVFVLATVSHKLRAEECKITPLDRAEANDIVAFLISRIDDKNCYSCSLSWSQKRKPAGYHILGYAQGRLETAREVTQALGLFVTEPNIEGQQAFFVSFLPEGSCEAFRAQVRAWWKAVGAALRAAQEFPDVVGAKQASLHRGGWC